MVLKKEEELLPFQSLEKALLTRIETWRNVFLVVTGVLLIVIFFQQRTISHELFKKTNESVVIVPGAPEFFRVRPGQIPDESVFLFAEYVAANLGSFSYKNAAYHLDKVSRYMHPEVKNQFESAYQAKLKDWTDRKVDQTYAYEPVKKYDLIKDSKGALYVAAVEGTRTQYVEGQAFSETRDFLVVEFRPLGNLTPERPYLFEIEKLNWMSPDQWSSYKTARDLGKEQKS